MINYHKKSSIRLVKWLLTKIKAWYGEEFTEEFKRLQLIYSRFTTFVLKYIKWIISPNLPLYTSTNTFTITIIMISQTNTFHKRQTYSLLPPFWILKRVIPSFKYLGHTSPYKASWKDHINPEVTKLYEEISVHDSFDGNFTPKASRLSQKIPKRFPLTTNPAESKRSPISRV